MVRDPNRLKKIGNAFGFNGLIEQNLMIKETLENTDWVEDLCTPEVFKMVLNFYLG